MIPWHLAVEASAYALSFASLWFTTRKSLWGPILGILDFLPWTAIAVYSHTYSLILFNGVYLVMTIRQYLIWRRSPH